MPKYPHISIELSDSDGNAFAILGRFKKALRKGGVSDQEITDLVNEATAGDYDHLLKTVFDTVEVE